MEKNRYGHILTENFQEAVGAWIKNYSNNIAIIEGERKITYRELGNLIIRCRKFFFEQGVKKGDNIAVHMGNHSEFIMVFLSLVTMGAVPILILSAQKKNEVRGIVRVATPKLYIYDAAVSVLGSLVAEGNKELKGIEKTIFTSMLESSEVEKTKEETYKEQIVPEDLALLLLSGGTTGIPKLIPRTHGDYLYNVKRITETIEAAKRWSWDDLLKEMMKTPTIRGVAKILSNQAGENEQDKSLVIIKEAAESSEKKVTVVFHAGTGTLTPYNSLIAYITERSQENEAVMGFTFGDEAEYLAIPTDKIFENLGKKYGRILSELGFTEYTLIGHCVGGLIALETAHYLKDKGKNVSSVTLLSTSIPHKKEETVLADLDMKIFETAVQTSLYNELLLERTFASLIDADIKKAGHQVDNDTLQQVIEYLIFNNGGNITVQALCSLTGKFAEVGAEFQRLHSMSATERMNDLYTTIERPNGQLMEHQRKMLNVLFRVFAQNFRCVSSYIPKVYTGKMRVFDCESAIANFFPSLFSEDKKTWEQYAQGEFLFDTMKGDHISCMNSPYIEENVKKILDL